MNKIISVAQFQREIASIWRQVLDQQKALGMFIEGQYSWERPEFDDHA